MTKKEKIKEAWGNVSDKINEDGWLYFGYACNGWDDVEEWLESNKLNSDESYYHMTYDQCDNGDLICVQIRPKSLQGIENYYSFKDITGFENYQVNKQGVVVSKSRVSLQKNGKKYTVKEKVMKPQIDNTGYIVFGLRNNNKQTKKVYLHRILAECFIPNIENKPCVNHKDGVKYNNNLSNLEWCTYKENNIHAFETGLQKKGKEHHFYGKKGIECHNHKNYQPIEKPKQPIY